ncbi:MAG: hypothetical protein RL038_276 [Actinomycetota bacterium]|jgi:hypothetical protein
MSELAITLLRFGFLLVLWLAIFLVLNLMRRDLNRAERRKQVRPDSMKLALPTNLNRKSRINKLVVLADGNPQNEYPLQSGMTIGRAESNSVVIQDEYASSVHAEITMDDAGWIYSDKGSTNGSWIGRKRVVEPVRLRQGSEIRINQTTLRFVK